MNEWLKTRWMAVALVLVGFAAGPVLAQGHENHDGDDDHGTAAADSYNAAGPVLTWEGEIVDLHCFLLHPERGQGKEHAACAKTCMNKGLPIGFLTGGQVYLLLGHEHESIKAQVAAMAGRPVSLTGVVVEHHGLKAIQLHGVKAVRAEAASAPAAAKDVWVCPMGDSPASDKPGKCPTCGMDRVKKKS